MNIIPLNPFDMPIGIASSIPTTGFLRKLARSTQVRPPINMNFEVPQFTASGSEDSGDGSKSFSKLRNTPGGIIVKFLAPPKTLVLNIF